MTPGNTHDSHIFEPLVEQVIGKVGKPKAVAAGDAYFRCHEFEEDGKLDMARSRNGLINKAK